MTAQTAVLLGTALTAVVTLIVGIYTARQGRQAKRDEGRAAPYEALARRVEALEKSDANKGKRIAALERRESRLIEYVRDLWRWIIAGAQPPPPIVPPDLHDVLPPSEWHLPAPPAEGDGQDTDHTL